jgi:hypothetical protein
MIAGRVARAEADAGEKTRNTLDYVRTATEASRLGVIFPGQL